MFEEGKIYTIREIIKMTGQKQSTVFRRREKLFPDKDINPETGIMTFTAEEAELLSKFQKRGR